MMMATLASALITEGASFYLMKSGWKLPELVALLRADRQTSITLGAYPCAYGEFTNTIAGADVV
jgi:hypothetical protein